MRCCDSSPASVIQWIAKLKWFSVGSRSRLWYTKSGFRLVRLAKKGRELKDGSTD